MLTDPSDNLATLGEPVTQVSALNNEDIQAIWQETLALIRTRVNSRSFKTWFEPIAPDRITRDRLYIQVPSQFFSEWLEEHYCSLINEVLTFVTKREMVVDYTITSDDRDLPQTDAEEPVVPGVASPVSPLADVRPTSPAPQGRSAPRQQQLSTTLNPRYTFQNYIKGESNQFASAAALAVANNPGGTSFNPLLLYGGVGLGKTHLIQAIGNHCIAAGKTKNILYVSSEKFTIDFVEAIQKDNMAEFSSRYRGVDLLIVDDIQFFAGKEKTQDVFFHTFNDLHQIGKQIVLSSDRPPKDLKGLNERLISRVQWGLMADIQPPDLETRIAILRKKSMDDGFEITHEILEFIAANVTSNIRELEGCYTTLIARSSIQQRPIDMDLAREVVRSTVGEVRSYVTIEEIQRIVCEELGIPEELIRAKTRKQEVVNARQIAMYLTKELTNSSLKTIGLHFGGRDHSTVIHAYQTVEDGMHTDQKQKQLVDHLRNKLERAIF